jgi:hypothetical protein
MSFLGKLAKMKKTHKALKNVLLTSLCGKLVKMKKILKSTEELGYLQLLLLVAATSSWC